MYAFSLTPVNEIPWVCNPSCYRPHGLSRQFSNLKLYWFSMKVWNAFCRIDRSRLALSLRKRHFFSRTAHRISTKASWWYAGRRCYLQNLARSPTLRGLPIDLALTFGGLASRFPRKAGAFVDCEKPSSYPLFTCPFLHRNLSSS